MTLRLFSFIGGSILFFYTSTERPSSILIQSLFQWIASIAIVQSLVLGSWKFNRLLLNLHFPRMLTAPGLCFHLFIRSFVLCGACTAFSLFLKLSLSSPTSQWRAEEGIFFSIGLGLLTLLLFWVRFKIQKMISLQLGVKFWRSISLTILVFTRIIFAAVGIICTCAVVLADWLGLDPTPGWGITRKLQFTAGLTLLLAGYLLYDRTIHLWLLHRLGRPALKKTQKIIGWLTRTILFVSGSVTLFLVGNADWLGLDPTPGWGWPRRLQFLGGILLVLSGIFLQNEYLKRWSYQHHGLKVLSPNQINLMIAVRILMVATGIVIVFLVFSADFFKIDPTPGWSEARFFQLAAGIALVATGFISHHATLLRWNLRRLFDDER